MATKVLTAHFTTGGTPITGLVPVIDIIELGNISNTLVISGGALTEIGIGWYRYNFTTYDPTKNYVFTIDGGVSLPACERYKYGGNESYVEDISSEVWNEPITSHLSSGSTGEALAQAKANTATIIINEVTMLTLLNTLLKYQRNRTKIDIANKQLIIFEDDCVTPLTVFNLKDFNGMPSVQDVCERVPTTCGP